MLTSIAIAHEEHSARPELGGFRHSDTGLVTDDGIEVLTYYPRDLASLVIAI